MGSNNVGVFFCVIRKYKMVKKKCVCFFFFKVNLLKTVKEKKGGSAVGLHEKGVPPWGSLDGRNFCNT